MDRSNFYFRQLTTELNLDQVFDDTERMEQDRTIDADTWGVWRGLLVTEGTVPPTDLTVKISAGVAHDEMGRRIECPSTQSVDLSTYLPVTPGNTRKIHIYVENADIASDPRIDGNGNPLNYRRAESFQIAIVAGVEGSPGVAPGIVADRVLLAEITLAQGQTTILDADIATDWQQDQRQPGGMPWRRGRLVVDDLYFNTSDDRMISGPAHITLKTGGTPGTDTGLASSDRDITSVGKLSMTADGSGGLGIDMNDTPIAEALSVTLKSGGTPGVDSGIVCNHRDITSVGRLLMTAIGSSGLGINMQDTPITNVAKLTFDNATAGDAIDMQGRDIDSLDELKFAAVATGIGSLTDPLPVAVSLDLTAKDIIKATQVQARSPEGDNYGHRYAIQTTGVLTHVEKWWSCDASQMKPGEQSASHEHDQTTTNGWFTKELVATGFSMGGDASWRMDFIAPDGDNRTPLFIPLTAIPHKSKLISASCGYLVDGAGMAATHYLRMYLLRRSFSGASSVTTLNATTPPSLERNTAPGDYTWGETFTDPTIVNCSTYAYFVAIVNVASGGAVGVAEDVIGIKNLRVYYRIREASGVW